MAVSVAKRLPSALAGLCWWRCHGKLLTVPLSRPRPLSASIHTAEMWAGDLDYKVGGKLAGLQGGDQQHKTSWQLVTDSVPQGANTHQSF